MPQSYTANKGEDPTPKQLQLGLFGQGCNQSPETLAWVAFGVIGPCIHTQLSPVSLPTRDLHTLSIALDPAQ